MIDYFTDNSLRRTTYNVSLVNLLTVLIFQPRVLTDGIWLDRIGRILIVPIEDMPFTPHFDQKTDYPFTIIEALASEFNFSHNYSCLRLLILAISAAIFNPVFMTFYFFFEFLFLKAETGRTA